jgi:hypothetical protein
MTSSRPGMASGASMAGVRYGDSVGTTGRQSDDEMRRKFKEALARKQHKGTAPGQGVDDDGSAKSHSKQARQQRVFRRKSG